MSLKKLLCCTAAGAFFHPAYAQSSAPSEDVVIVEGTRLGQTAREVGSSVSIIDREDLKTLDFDFALDAIALAPGVTINQNGAFGGQASVRIRGAASAQTLVLIDGVPVNDTTSPSGGFDFGRLDTENIERIEILKGPQSVFWGSDAIGGVVSITTKTPGAGTGGTVFGEVGSFSTFRGGASVENANALYDLRLSATGTTSDGISKADEANGDSENDGFDGKTLSANAGLNLPADIRLDADILWTDASTEFDSFSVVAEGSVADGDELAETEELSTNLSLRAPLLAGRFQNLLLIGYSDIDRENLSGGITSSTAQGDRTILRYQGTFEVNGANTVAFGAEREEMSANDDETSINSAFGLYELKPFSNLTLTAGVRHDEHEQFGGETTARVAAAYSPKPDWIVRASWGQGFKAPTIFQQTFICTFCGLTEPNRALQPETSEGFDVGVEWRPTDGRAFAGLTYFDQDTENLIDFSFTAGYDNIALAETRGVEAVVGYQLASWLGLDANYTYLEAEDGSGNSLSRLPEHSGEIRATVDPAGPFSGAVIARYNGEETNTDGTTLDAWTRVDITARYALSDQLELYGRAENLFDEDYQQILGYGTPGLSGSVGVRLRY